MGVWSIVLSYINISSKSPKGKTGLHFRGNMKQSAIVGVTEPTLDVAHVAPHQLKDDTAPIMTLWLPGLSFSVETSLSAQHHQVCNKSSIKLSTLG